LQRQTFGNFEAIISVDGGDEETAVACQPFLTDPRFRMIVHPERLDWVGNFNWLLQQDLQEFFCYRQHDDTTAPEFFEVLLQAADKEPKAAAIYSDCRYNQGNIEVLPSIEGEPLHRVFQYVHRVSAVPVSDPLLRLAHHGPKIRRALGPCIAQTIAGGGDCRHRGLQNESECHRPARSIDQIAPHALKII
jgi:glycosyltransferase involved in cell wall biosynthesis